MKQYFYIFLILMSFESFACECGNVIGVNFYNNVDYFDAIVMGKFNDSDTLDATAIFVIEKVFKGKIQTNEIGGGGIDCTIIPGGYNREMMYIIGLKSKNHNYSLPACIESTIEVNNNRAYGVLNYFSSFLWWIGIRHINSVSIKKLERKISRKNRERL